MKQKLLYITLMILCALAWSGEAWGEEWSKSVSTKYTYGSSDYNNNNANPFKFSNTSDGHQSDKVTINFSLSGGGLSRYRFGAFGMYEYSLRGQNNNGSTATFGWTVPDAYDIRVTKVSSTAKTSVNNSTTLQIGNGSQISLKNGGQTVSSGDISLGVGQTLSYYYKTSGAAYFHLYDFSVDYTLYQYRFHAKSTATAVPSSGGTAYTSFTSYDAATNSSATKTSDWGRSTSASTDIYYKAAVASADSYVFKGWTLADKTTYTSTNSVGDNVQKKWEGFTYNGANSDNPSSAALKAWFAPKATFNVSVGVGTVVGGTASTNWSPSTKTLEGTPGGTTVSTSVTYSATVSNTDSYKFCGWAESGTETDNSKITGGSTYNVNLQGSAGSTVNKTLYAIYAPIYYFKATANVGEHGGGTANASVTNRVEGTPNAQSGSAQASFTAEPYDGYVFVGWSESKSATTEECISHENPYNNVLIENFNPGSDNEVNKTLYAIFAPVFNFSATYTKNRDGGTVTAEVASATITGDPGDTSASTTATFRATPTEGSYVFKGWKTAVNDEDYESNENPYTTSGDKNITNSTPGSTATKKLVAIFAPLYNFSATAGVGSVKGGTVSVSGYSTQVEGAPDAEEGTTTATYTATANEGYKFAGWSESANGNIVYTDNPHNQTLTNKSPGTSESLTLYAIFKLDGLELNPGDPSYTPDNYSSVTLSRTLKAGYSTIALPFDTDVSELVTGRTEPYNNANDWVAQLDIVTYSVADGYTLYFQKVDGGTITANQPYVLHLGYEVKDPTWTDTTNGITVATASAASVTPSTGYSGYAGWVMKANYEVGFNMNGKYGIVNNSQLTGTNQTTYPDGGLKLGGSGSSLNAFTAYITGPTSGPNGAPRLRVAYVDEDGTATFIGSLPEDDLQGEPVAIYGPDGQRRSKMQRGVNIVRYADGTTKKVQL